MAYPNRPPKPQIESKNAARGLPFCAPSRASRARRRFIRWQHWNEAAVEENVLAKAIAKYVEREDDSRGRVDYVRHQGIPYVPYVDFRPCTVRHIKDQNQMNPNTPAPRVSQVCVTCLRLFNMDAQVPSPEPWVWKLETSHPLARALLTKKSTEWCATTRSRHRPSQTSEHSFGDPH